MADGTTKPIEEVSEGDVVLADDPLDDEPPEAQVVVGTSSSMTSAWVHLEVDVDGDGKSDERLSATPLHPIWVEDEGWMDAEEIAVGDWLRSEDGEGFEVVDVWVEKVESTRTYDLDVEGIDTFFVLGDFVDDDIDNTDDDVENQDEDEDNDEIIAVLVHNTEPCEINWSPKSKKTFGHIFEIHGAGKKKTKGLIGRANSDGKDQGQWLDDEKAAELLKSVYDEISGPETIKIPPGLGHVIKPDGSMIPTEWAIVVPKPGGIYKTAYPVLVP